jgi:hypothetical protein
MFPDQNCYIVGCRRRPQGEITMWSRSKERRLEAYFCLDHVGEMRELLLVEVEMDKREYKTDWKRVGF